jgi:hypothetical protein
LTGGSFQVTGQFPSRTVDATALNNELTVSGSNYVHQKMEVLLQISSPINGEAFRFTSANVLGMMFIWWIAA